MAGNVEPEILRHEGYDGATSLTHDEHGATSDAREEHPGATHTSVLVVPGFLPLDMCRRVREAMDRGTPETAGIAGETISVDEQVRRALHVEIDADVREALEARLEAFRSRLETFFKVPLGAREGLSLLRYGTGGFYRRHRDSGRVNGWPAAARRCVATVLFLASSRREAQDGTFVGGALRLFDGEAPGGYDVPARAGTLVAFPATLPHEVTDVTEGVRDTAVDWFECRMPNAEC